MTDSSPSSPLVGRNELCPCGSRKKFKRCHGVDAAPKLGVPKALSSPAVPPGVDPSQFDPALVQQMAGMMQRLPKGQLQKLQTLMQKAMAGKDVTKEAMELEKVMPPEFLQSMESLRPQLMSQAAAAGMPTPEDSEMSEEEAKRIVEEAVKSGKLSADEAAKALAGEGTSEPGTEKSGRWGKLWGSLKGKK